MVALAQLRQAGMLDWRGKDGEMVALTYEGADEMKDRETEKNGDE